MSGPRIPFDDREDLMILEEREKATTWQTIGRMLGRDKDTVRARHAELVGPRRRIARTGGYENRGEPIEAWPTPADDAAHIAALRKLGGFDIRNMWTSLQGRALP